MRPFTAAIALTSAVGFALLPASAFALLLSVDDAGFGAGALTRDTQTGLEWLDLSLSGGRSYDQVTTELQAGGAFAGFRYAGFDEVRTLWANAGIGCATAPAGCASDVASGAEAQRVLDFVTLTGQTGVVPGTSFGIQTGVLGEPVAGPPGVGLHAESVILFALAGTPPTAQLELNRSLSFAFDDQPAAGHWLVRSSPAVPEPGAALVFAVGLAVVSRFGRR